jgi:hypothetical protein
MCGISAEINVQETNHPGKQEPRVEVVGPTSNGVLHSQESMALQSGSK